MPPPRAGLSRVLNATVVNRRARTVVLQWEDYRFYINDFRTLLGYNVYYREAPHRNLTMFTGRDACGSGL